MKRLLIPLLAALALPTAVNANWFSRDIVEITEVGEKTIIKNSTVKVEKPITVKDYFEEIKSSSTWKNLKNQVQGYLEKWEVKYAKCLETGATSFCNTVQEYPKTINYYKKQVALYENKIKSQEKRVKVLTPEFQKFNENQIILIPIKYTPIFEDINGKKIVRDQTKVLCLNQSKDYSSLEINKSDYELNSLEKKICKKYAKF